MTEVKTEQEPTMDQILQSIRNVVSSSSTKINGSSKTDKEVLDLTDMVNDDGTVTSIKPASSAPANTLQRPVEPVVRTNKDVLSSIDNILSRESDPEPNPQATQETSINANPKESTKMIEEVINQQPDVNAQTNLAVNQSNIEKEDTVEAKGMVNALISEQAALESAAALKQLIKPAATLPASTMGFRSGVTLETLVIELLKPQLSEWLNENLPNIVKSIVEKEIKKLIPRDSE